MSEKIFNLNAYLGTWYELMHYPSWFQRNHHYNTTATYCLNNDGTISVENSTIANGVVVTSLGTATQITNNKFHVEFSMPEVNKLLQNKQFSTNNNFQQGPYV